MKKLTKTARMVWKYLSLKAKENDSNFVICKMDEIAKSIDRTVRMVQYSIHELDGKIQVIYREKILKHKTRYKNLPNEFIITEFFDGTKPRKNSSIIDLKSFKVFKEKDLKAEDEIFSPSDTDSLDIHTTTENRTSELPLLIERNLPHLVQGYAFTVVDFVMNKFKRLLKMGKITHMIAWIRGALANEQAIYDAIGFDMYITRGKQADRNKSASKSAPKSAPRAKTNRSSNPPTNRPSRPSLPMPVYESPVVEQSEVERILTMAREYQKEKTACAV